MKDSARNDQLDKEWVRLIKTAKHLGFEKEKIRQFLQVEKR
ncbi:anti-repressor SinI family protein [Halobacillus seohaensis]|uniref:Anti-repressor SinI family protein n=1 Tax=Halobacillus seohaensis TaxID=447421 RepID=A0ABW2EQ43_9BACI